MLVRDDKRINRLIARVNSFFYIYAMYEDLPLNNNEAIHNFELFVNGHRAFIDYQQRGNRFFLLHTEVPHELEGHGVAAALVDKTFKYLEANNFKVVPYCEYVKVYLKRHPEWEQLLG